MTVRLEGRPRETASPLPGPAAAAGQTAPHETLMSVVRDLLEGPSREVVTIDAVAQALKARGFQRPPGSPRLVTRLRRTRELLVSASGTVTWASADRGQRPVAPVTGERQGGGPPSQPGPASGGDGSIEQAPPGAHRRRRRRRGATHRRRTAGAPRGDALLSRQA